MGSLHGVCPINTDQRELSGRQANGGLLELRVVAFPGGEDTACTFLVANAAAVTDEPAPTDSERRLLLQLSIGNVTGGELGRYAPLVVLVDRHTRSIQTHFYNQAMLEPYS